MIIWCTYNMVDKYTHIYIYYVCVRVYMVCVHNCLFLLSARVRIIVVEKIVVDVHRRVSWC